MRGETKWRYRFSIWLHVSEFHRNIHQQHHQGDQMHTQHNDQLYLNRVRREKIVLGFDEMIQEHGGYGRDRYFLNFMFNHIRGSQAAKMDTMIAEVTRVHHILTRHVVRRPNAEAWRHLRPIFIGCHDLPVWKHEKELVQNLVVNDGLHFNAVALLPRPALTVMDIKLQFRIWGRQSRLKVPLQQHLWDKRRFYHNDALSRIHVTPITRGTMADYMLKTFKHVRVGPDSIQVWN